MSSSQYGTPVIVNNDKTVNVLERIPLAGDFSDYDENYIQDIAFKYPNCLPIAEIDRTYEGLIPVCRELNTPAGPLDVLYITPQGRLVILEAKLWRNPEARRKVVGQILDYAKELSQWDYEDLQREVSRSTGRKGNVLFEVVKEHHPKIEEIDFVDEVTRSLKRGRFLLLILGDGIREGVGAITQFLEEVGTLEFTFGLVELALYRTADSSILVQPRVLAKTVIFKRTVVSLKEEQLTIEDDTNEKEEQTELSDKQKFYVEFWPEFLEELKLDDISQPMPKSTGKQGNIFFPMPPSGGQAWITVYFYQNWKQTGLFLTFARGSYGDMAYEHLLTDKENIELELGADVTWKSENGKHSINLSRTYDDLMATENREDIKRFLKYGLNNFVNVFRPRLERIAKLGE